MRRLKFRRRNESAWRDFWRCVKKYSQRDLLPVKINDGVLEKYCMKMFELTKSALLSKKRKRSKKKKRNFMNALFGKKLIDWNNHACIGI